MKRTSLWEMRDRGSGTRTIIRASCPRIEAERDVLEGNAPWAEVG